MRAWLRQDCRSGADRPGFWSGWLIALALALAGLTGFAAPSAGQVVTFTKSTSTEAGPQIDGSGALSPRKSTSAPPPKAAGPGTDGATIAYDDWIEVADRAETIVENPRTLTRRLEALRDELVQWREAFLGAQSANVQRIKTIKDQIAALGPAPAEAASEAAEIKARRRELDNQLARAEAPILAAEEAYRRADGLIREIDRELRSRKTDALLKLWPSPINPVVWPEALVAGRDVVFQAMQEARTNWRDPQRRANFTGALPVTLTVTLLGFALFRYGRRFLERLVMRLRYQSAARWSNVWANITSLGGLLVPVLGAALIAIALGGSGLAGPVLENLIFAVANFFGPVILAGWIAFRLFPVSDSAGLLGQAKEGQGEARWLTTLLGLTSGFEAMRASLFDTRGYSDGALSVLSFPGLVVTALLLFRLGKVLRRHVAAVPAEAAGGHGSLAWLIGLVGKICGMVAVLGLVLATIGYIPAANLLVYATLHSLALLSVLWILQGFFADLHAAMINKGAEGGREGLVPILFDFVLVVAALPLLALIWGVRQDELFEIWARMREGITFGSTTISPTNFMVFATIFTIGYLVTRAMQRTLRISVLPRTRMDLGGQNAVISGLGYLGIFLSALLAIRSAGIDLSGLAIVAGGLSLGIGFGMQTVVSNFISGIILLVERPFSEGDWIESGTAQGIVKSISVRSTRIQTFDRSDVIIPNSDLITGRVTNWTRFNLTGRLIIPVSVPFTADSRQVETVLREIAEDQPLAILNPPPIVALMGFGAETMNFEIRLILRDVNQQLAVRSDVNHAIARRFAVAGIPLSSAHRDHLERKSEQAAADTLAAEETLAHQMAVAALVAETRRLPPRPPLSEAEASG